MKIFTKIGIKQKIISVLIIILLFQYVNPIKSNAGAGGVLFSPIQSLVLTLGDVGEMMLNLATYGNSKVILTLSTDPTLFDKITDGMIYWGTGGLIGEAVDKVPVLGNVHKGIVNGIKGFKNWAVKTFNYFFSDEDFEKDIDLPIMLVTPDKIFSNKIPLLDVNIINPNTYYTTDDNGNEVEVKDSPVNILQKTISSWYSILRNIATVAFLSVLVYIGIRIIISSVASEKAKYKQMLMDWIVGLCLLFSMHYIMSFLLFATEKITDLLDINNSEIIIENEDIDIMGKYNGSNAKVVDLVKYYNRDKDDNVMNSLCWRTDMAGYIRYLAQSNIKSTSVTTKMGLSVLYITLVIYTYIFMFQYLKRLLIIIFLTLISPFVALAYPLDKIGDGKAQAFNMWFKEYLINLLIQPMHLILYTVLVGSAIELATDHPLYAIVVFGFMLQAEKLIKKMFKLDRADTVGNAAGGAFTGAMVMQGVNSVIKNIKSKGNDNNKKSGGNVKSGDNDSRIRLADNRSADNGAEDERGYMDSVLGAGTELPEEETNQGVKQEQEPTTEGVEADNKQIIGKSNQDNRSNKFDDVGANNYTLSDSGIYLPNDMIANESKNKNERQNSLDDANNIKNTGESNIEKDNNNHLVRDKSNLSKAKRKVFKPNYAKAAAKLYGPKLIKKTLKTAAIAGTAAVGAGTLGMIGVAAGLSSDDYTNVLKYGAAGVTGGMLGGKISAEKAISAPENIANMASNWSQNKKEEIIKEAYKNNPEEYKEYLNKKSDREFMNNKEIKQKYVEAFGADNAKGMMEKAQKYREHGVTDNDVIIKAMKQKSDLLGTEVDDDRRIVAAKLASNIDNEKDLENKMKRLGERGVPKNKIKEQEKILRNMKNMY